MNLNGFFIDTAASDDPYLFIDVDGFTVAIKSQFSPAPAKGESSLFACKPAVLVACLRKTVETGGANA